MERMGRKDMERMGSAMKMVRNPREWTPPQHGLTPEQMKQNRPQHNEFKEHWEREMQRYKKSRPTKAQMEQNRLERNRDQFYKGYGGIEMTGHPGEYLMGGGAIGGFKTAKTLVGKVMEYGSKYAIKSAKNSIKTKNLVSNSL